MSKDEPRRLLAQQTTEQASCGDETAVDELLETHTCLPLAIVQADAFMNTKDVSVSGYLALFRDSDAQAELFNEGFAGPNRYDESHSTIAKSVAYHMEYERPFRQGTGSDLHTIRRW